jgi:hypothetical protein
MDPGRLGRVDAAQQQRARERLWSAKSPTRWRTRNTANTPGQSTSERPYVGFGYPAIIRTSTPFFPSHA